MNPFSPQDLHGLPSEALVHWDRDMAEAFVDKRFELYVSAVENDDLQIGWDCVAWWPMYSHANKFLFLHIEHGWVFADAYRLIGVIESPPEWWCGKMLSGALAARSFQEGLDLLANP